MFGGFQLTEHGSGCGCNECNPCTDCNEQPVQTNLTAGCNDLVPAPEGACCPTTSIQIVSEDNSVHIVNLGDNVFNITVPPPVIPPPPDEEDPVALGKTITINPGAGVIIGGAYTQTIGSNPEYTVSISEQFVRNLFSATGDITYNFLTGEFNVNIDPEDFKTFIQAGSNITITGVGSELNPYIISASAPPPTFTLFTEDTITVDLSGAGTLLSPLKADVNISQQPNNAIFTFPDGLYAVNTIKSGIVYGGIVTWVSGYTYHISAAGYYINGVFYTSPATTVTLDAPDGTFNRFDSFIVNTLGQVVVLEGTPSSNPALPPLDPATQLHLSNALVETGTTQPTINNECIFRENTEWFTASSNTLLLKPNSTVSPANGAISIEGSNVVNATSLNFTRFAPITPVPGYTVLKFEIKSKANWGNANRKLALQFFNGLVPVGNAVQFGNGNFGFAANNTTTYQTIAIPLTDFGLTAASVIDRFRILANLPNGNIGFYIDDICFQGVTLPETNPPTDKDEKVKVSFNDTTPGYLNGKLVAGSGITFTETNDGGNETLIISSNGGGGGSPTDIIKFHVGDVGFPGDDASTYTNPALIGQAIRLYREGERMFEGDTSFGITFNSGTGVVTFFPLLTTGERIIIEILDVETIAGGSVSSFTADSLSPLFTTNVTSGTTTPNLAFSLVAQPANTVFAGPTSGGSSLTSFRTLVAADLPDFFFGSEFIGSGVDAEDALALALNSVIFSKIQTIGSSKILGRFSTGTGVIQELTIGSGLNVSSGGVLTATGGGGGGGFARMYNDTVTGTLDGVNLVFTTTADFISGTTAVWLNGLRLMLGAGNDYTETDVNEITFSLAPQAGDNIIIEYDLL